MASAAVGALPAPPSRSASGAASAGGAAPSAPGVAPVSKKKAGYRDTLCAQRRVSSVRQTGCDGVCLQARSPPVHVGRRGRHVARAHVAERVAVGAGPVQPLLRVLAALRVGV